jgi:hypothetical protein
MDHRRGVALRVAELVGGVQPVARLTDHARGDPERLRVAWQLPRQGLPGHPPEVLHDHEQLAALLVQLEHLADVRVRELRRDPTLVEEHVAKQLVLGKVRQDPLDRDQLLEPARAVDPREVQLGHAAPGELHQQLVVAERFDARKPHSS